MESVFSFFDIFLIIMFFMNDTLEWVHLCSFSLFVCLVLFNEYSHTNMSASSQGSFPSFVFKAKV